MIDCYDLEYMLSSGMSLQMIAEELGVDYYVIYELVRECGVTDKTERKIAGLPVLNLILRNL